MPDSLDDASLTIREGRASDAPTTPASVVTSVDAIWDATDVQSILREIRLSPAKRLKLEGKVASGGMGSIEAVFDRALMRRVAKKMLHPELASREGMVRMFLREARVTGLLDHPNIVPVHDIGEMETDGEMRLYFTMKLVQGRPLKQIIRDYPPGALEMTTLFNLLDVTTKVCDALAFAHNRGVLHCDVKPDNVMVGDFGQVYLMDWGVARLTRRAHVEGDTSLGEIASETSGTDQLVIGTPSYMSPEQAEGRRATLCPRADVFLVGALLYEALARRPPYVGANRVELLRRAERAYFPPLGMVCRDHPVPPELERIVTKAMAKERSQRYPSTLALKDDLIRFMRGGAEYPQTTFAKGSYVVREGDAGDAAYIIVNGKCQVLQVVQGTASVLQTLGPGQVFGEMAVLTEGPRTASVLAVEDTTLLVVTRRVFEQEMEQMKPWMARLFQSQASRVRDFYTAERITHVGAHPARIAMQILLHLRVFGTASSDGTLSMKWTKACEGIEAQLGSPVATAIMAVAARYPMIRVDLAADVVELRDVAELAAALREEANL